MLIRIYQKLVRILSEVEAIRVEQRAQREALSAVLDRLDAIESTLNPGPAQDLNLTAGPITEQS